MLAEVVVVLVGVGVGAVLWRWGMRRFLRELAWRREGQRVHLSTSRRLARYRDRLDRAARAT